MKTCSYCNESGTLTKEHIWPSNIIKKYDTKLASYNKKIDKLVYSDPVIKDVCSKCNNELLSPLDSYLSELYDSYLYQSLKPGESTSIELDFEMLSRALLKISYNSSRALADDDIKKAHEKFKTYILKGGYLSGLHLRLIVVTSARIIAYGELLDQMLPVTQLRCADIAYDGDLSNRFIVRLIAINSFWFYLIISKKPEKKDKWERFINGFSSWKIQPGLEIKPTTRKLEFPVNQTTYMSKELLGTLCDAFKNS